MSNSESLKGKRLLILGGAAQCLKVVEAAKALGVYTIVTDIKDDGTAKRAADEALPYSVMDVEGLYSWCLEHPIDGVLNYCVDPAQKTHQALCDRFGFPSYGTKEQYHALTDKAVFKKLCVENRVDIIPEYDENDLSSVAFPVLVKPAESSGSRGISVCSTKEELMASVERAKALSRSGKVIIEKYMGDKQDFTVTYLIVDGTPYLIRIGDRQLGKMADGLDKQCICTTSPSTSLDLYIEKAQDRVLDLLNSLKIQNGPVFFQGFIDNDKFRFYDPGFRFPGGEYDNLLYAATGINIMEAMVLFALTGKIPLSKEQLKNAYRLNNHLAVQLTIAARAGEIAVYEGFEKVKAIPEVVCIAQKAHVGSVIIQSGDVQQRVLEVAYLADNYNSAKTLATTIYESLTILDKEGKDMVVSKGFSLQ